MSSRRCFWRWQGRRLANTVWAFATVGQVDDALFAALARTAESRFGSFDAHQQHKRTDTNMVCLAPQTDFSWKLVEEMEVNATFVVCGRVAMAIAYLGINDVTQGWILFTSTYTELDPKMWLKYVAYKKTLTSTRSQHRQKGHMKTYTRM